MDTAYATRENGRDGIRCAEETKYGQFHSNPAFSSIAFFAKALNRRPFDLAVNSCAVGIITENKRVAGIRVMSADKKSYVLKSKTVVLAASTFQNPRLLLASGIPGGAIGHYLTTHSLLGITGYLDRKQFPEVLGNLGIVIPAREDDPFNWGSMAHRKGIMPTSSTRLNRYRNN